MSDMLYKVEYIDKNRRIRTDSYLKNMLRSAQPREVRLVLPHLIRLSLYQSDMLNLILSKEDKCIADVDSNQEGDEESIELVESIEDGSDGLKYREFLCINCSRRDRPRPFSALPYGRLRPSMVYYGDTEIKQLLSHIKTSTAKKSNKKRTRKVFEEDGADVELPMCLSACRCARQGISGIHKEGV